MSNITLAQSRLLKLLGRQNNQLSGLLRDYHNLLQTLETLNQPKPMLLMQRLSAAPQAKANK